MLSPFERLGMPVHELAMMYTIAIRFVPTLFDEASHIMTAQAARGARLDDGRLIDRVKFFVPILVPLFASALRHAEELANAMEARCYVGGEGRTHYPHPQGARRRRRCYRRLCGIHRKPGADWGAGVGGSGLAPGTLAKRTCAQRPPGFRKFSAPRNLQAKESSA